MFQTVNSWARKNFGSVAGAVIALMSSVAGILQHAIPIVRRLDDVKEQWKNEDGTEHDFKLILELVSELNKSDEKAMQIADAVYVHKNVSATLFNAAVLLLRQRAPVMPTPILNATVEIAYNVMLLLRK